MPTPVTLITGTSTGIGRATALHLARRGHRVYATMRSPDRAGGPLLDAAKAEGLQLTVSALDVTEPASVEKAIDAAVAESGRIDVLVNNAGLADLGVVELTNEDITRRMFETNVFGPLRTMRAVLPAMRERGSGTIVNVSSVAGRLTYASGALYSGTKHALEAISESLAAEVNPFGVRVAIIEPGFFDTPILDKATGPFAGTDSSPYAHVARRVGGTYQASKQGIAGDPQLVAEAIEQAIKTDAPRLRYLVGIDAPVMVEGRAKMTDEEYLHAFGRVMTDDEWFTEFVTRFPMPTA